MKTMKIFLFLVVLESCIYGQAQWLKTTDITKWEDSPDVKYVEGDVYFTPAKVSDRSKEYASIKVSAEFQNTGQKQIKSITFEIVLFCKKAETEDKLERVNVKPLVYARSVPSGEKAGFEYQPAFEELTLPVKQIVRVSEIEYEDGSLWKRRKS